jgi:hypothetical protein
MGFIKNINSVFIPRFACSTWYEHWERASQQWLICCAEHTCTKPISQGALVQKAEENDDKWYIVPLCKQHSKSNDILNIGDVELVAVDATLPICKRSEGQN